MSNTEMYNQPDVWDLLSVGRRQAWFQWIAPMQPEDVWNQEQQPVLPTGAEPSFRLLRAALDVGWQISEPVYLRPHSSDECPRVYHFILKRQDESGTPRLLTVPQHAEVERFVREQGLRVARSH